MYNDDPLKSTHGLPEPTVYNDDPLWQRRPHTRTSQVSTHGISYRARVLVHSLHAQSSRASSAFFELRQGDIESTRLSILKTFKKAPSLVLTSTRTRACGNWSFASVPTLRIPPCLSTMIEIRRGRECTHPQFVQYLIRSVPAFGRFAPCLFLVIYGDDICVA